MRLTKKIFLLLFSLLLISSCTLTKRRYSNGFHVDWFANQQSIKQIKAPNGHDVAFDSTPIQIKKKPIQSIFSEHRNDQRLVFANASGDADISLITNQIPLFNGIEPDTILKADRIILKTGDTLNVRIIEQQILQVQYQLFPVTSRATYIRYTKDISKLIYANGIEINYIKSKVKDTDGSVNKNDNNQDVNQLSNQNYADESNPRATWALVLGILSILLLWIPVLPIAPAILAIRLGKKGLNKSSELPNEKGRIMAKTGIVLGKIVIAVYILTLLLLAMLASTL